MNLPNYLTPLLDLSLFSIFSFFSLLTGYGVGQPRTHAAILD